MTQPTMAVEACARMVTASSHACLATVAAPEPQRFDALAASLGALSSGLTFGAIVIAILTVLAGYAWGRLIARQAKDEAVKAMRESVGEEVERVARPIIDAWLTTEGVEQMRQIAQMTQPSSLATDPDAADRIADRIDQ
ncbi:MAG: hypothetical protein ABI306_10810 [Caulobacteraceae bacterium]